MKTRTMIALGILAAGLPILAYCGAIQTGNIGVGIGADKGSGTAKIGMVFPGGPADRAGVKANWIIVSIDGTNILGEASTNCMQLLHGTVGTPVTLELADPQTHQTNKFIIQREDVPLPAQLFDNFSKPTTNSPDYQANPHLIAH